MVVRALEAVGDGDIINRFLVETDRKRLRKNLESGDGKVKQDQEVQKNWNIIN